MFRTSAVILALALLPSLSAAQVRRERGARDNSDSIARAMPSGPKLNSRDIEGISPMRFLLDKRKDLKLTDDQQKQIKDADGKLKEKNAPMLKQVDSLVREMKPSSMPTAEDEARVVIAREALMKLIGDIRVTYDASLKEMLTKLDETQNTTVQTLLPKQQQENADMLRERLGSRMGGGGGGGRRGERGA
jgi:hypothetical protein